MSKHLLGFPNKKERDDFLIAMVVIVFFGWIMTRTMGCDKLGGKLPSAGETAIIADATIVADADGDGVLDSEDRCPKTAGTKENEGCPLEVVEAVNTGVATKVATEKIPSNISETLTNGTAAVTGAASAVVATAQDSGKKLIDKVKTTPAPKPKVTTPIETENKDSDKDGILDKDDKCPNLTGTKANNGCPSDKDGDGVYDNIDKCPTVAGTKANKGCPEVADTDGDGIADKDDKCPNKKGIAANNGCPKVAVSKEEAEVLEVAIKAIEFDTGKDRLKRASLKILDKIIPILKKYPNYKLDIVGHTDNRGDAKQNMRLSRKRAKACLNYLVSKGIAANRITSSGKGDTQPIESNDTSDGRSKNRRVDFNLQD